MSNKLIFLSNKLQIFWLRFPLLFQIGQFHAPISPTRNSKIKIKTVNRNKRNSNIPELKRNQMKKNPPANRLYFIKCKTICCVYICVCDCYRIERILYQIKYTIERGASKRTTKKQQHNFFLYVNVVPEIWRLFRLSTVPFVWIADSKLIVFDSVRDASHHKKKVRKTFKLLFLSTSTIKKVLSFGFVWNLHCIKIK